MAHALLEFIREQMDVRGWTQADLARASGMSRSHVSKLLKDDRDRIAQLPREATINGVSTAFNVQRGVVLAKAVEALGVGYTAADFVHEITDATDDELLGEVARRLRERRGALGLSPDPPANLTVMSSKDHQRLKPDHVLPEAADAPETPAVGARARGAQDEAATQSQDDGSIEPR